MTFKDCTLHKVASEADGHVLRRWAYCSYCWYRGCITVMEQGGYAASGVKHCVRPVDMSGKCTNWVTTVLCMHVHASQGIKSENYVCGLHLLA